MIIKTTSGCPSMSVNPKLSLALSLLGFAGIALGFLGYTGLLKIGSSASVLAVVVGLVLVAVSYVHAFFGPSLLMRTQ